MLKRNVFIDALKGIACICVVFIHCQFPGDFGVVVGALSKFAVPIFLMISGYYAVKDDSLNCKRKVVQLARLTLLSESIYLLFGIVKVLMKGESSYGYLANLFSVDKIAHMIIVNTPIASNHLWFLYALVYCYLLLLVLHKYQLKSLALALMILGQIGFVVLGEGLTLLGVGYHLTLEFGAKTFDLVLYNCFIFRAFPYFLLGYLIRTSNWKLSISRITSIALLISGTICVLVERIYIGSFQFYIGTIPVVVVLFCWAINMVEVESKNKLLSPLSHIGRVDSDIVYIIHILVASIMLTFIKAIAPDGIVGTVVECIYPIVVVILSLLIAETRTLLTSSNKNQWKKRENI